MPLEMHKIQVQEGENIGGQAFNHVYGLFPFTLRTFSDSCSFVHGGNGSTRA